MRPIRPVGARSARSDAAYGGFTLVEVILSIMLLGMGILSILALTLAGTRSAQSAVALSTAYATARTALFDPSSVKSGSTMADASVDGYLNGYYVVRTIESTVSVAGSAMKTDKVQVQVYWGDSGAELAGITSFVNR